MLDQTLVILTADHGEQFGEHGGFGHGMSLYEPEVHVPLLVIFPGRVPEGQVVREAVSLRDIPATVVDLIGGLDGSPFPGRSLTRTWNGSPPEEPQASNTPLSELDAPIEKRPEPPQSRAAVRPSSPGARFISVTSPLRRSCTISTSTPPSRET